MFVMKEKKEKETKKTYKETSHSHSNWHLVSPVLRVIILYTRNHLLNNTPNIVGTIIINHWIYHFNLLLLLRMLISVHFVAKQRIQVEKISLKKSFSDRKIAVETK